MAEKLRPTHRVRIENEMIRRREKEFHRQQMWGGAEKYYKNWEKKNSKFDEWTSPRYYEDNNKLVEEIKAKREKEDRLEKRREKLRKLLEEEDRSYEIELMVHKSKNITTSRSNIDEISTDLLKDVNVGLKLQEEERRRHEAEMKLYHHWRSNNPIIRDYERKYKVKDMKLAWLDQQIEKRIKKEKEEAENKRFLKEREEKLKKEKEKEEMMRKQLEEKNKMLKEILKEQIQELKSKQSISDDLKRKETEENNLKIQLKELEDLQECEERRRLDRECALYNLRQHKLKLKQKVVDIQENLLNEQILIQKLKKLDLERSIEDVRKKEEIKEGLNEFLNIVKEQQELEKQRQKHLEFVFDSEAKLIFERQNQLWQSEEHARRKLMQEVISCVKQQIEENLSKNKEKQLELIKEREEMTTKIEEYEKEMERIKLQEEKRKLNRKGEIEEDIKTKNARKKEDENKKLKEINDELERIRKEEERLQKEILNIQRRQGPIRPSRSRILF